jgi:hypothetical protein
MSSFRSVLAGAAAALAVGAVALWLWPRAPVPAPAPPGAAPEPAAVPAPSARGVTGPALAPPAPAAAAAAPSPAAAAGHLHETEAEAAAEPDDDLLLYEREPMSGIPHRVVRGWGASEDRVQAGRVGAYVVVDPSISDEELIQLARDIRDYHRGANAVAVRILDSEEAATYDYHEDGGVRRDQHLVGRVQRDTALGVDAIQVRGESIEP